MQSPLYNKVPIWFSSCFQACSGELPARLQTYLPNNPVSLLRKGHNGRSSSGTFCIRDNCGLATFHCGDGTIGGPEIDSHNLRKTVQSVQKQLKSNQYPFKNKLKLGRFHILPSN